MRSKLPPDSFTYYASLGPQRSYNAVAAYFKVDKKTVVRRAIAEDWQKKIADIEKQALERTQQKLVVGLEEMNDRHLKILRAVMNKALETLRSMPLKTASDAVRAIDLCVRHERLILGDPSEAQAESIEEITKREFANWMGDRESDADETGGDDGEDGAEAVAQQGSRAAEPRSAKAGG